MKGRGRRLTGSELRKSLAAERAIAPTLASIKASEEASRGVVHSDNPLGILPPCGATVAPKAEPEFILYAEVECPCGAAYKVEGMRTERLADGTFSALFTSDRDFCRACDTSLPEGSVGYFAREIIGEGFGQGVAAIPAECETLEA